MNQEIPKPLRNALARQAVGDVHPSPDVLTSFLECTLPPVESEVVTHHLAQCAECREIVFLASDAAEDEVRERELAAAGTVQRRSPLPAIVRRSPVLRRGKTRPLKSRRKLPRRLVRPRHSQELRRKGRRLRTLGRSLHQLRSPVMPLMNSRPHRRRELLRERRVHKQPLALLAAWATLWFLRFVLRARSRKVKPRRRCSGPLHWRSAKRRRECIR